MKKDAKRHLKNTAEKSRVKTISKKVLAAVEAGDVTEAQSLLKVATKTIDQAMSNHVLHRNNAARKKSRLTLKVNAMTK